MGIIKYKGPCQKHQHNQSRESHSRNRFTEVSKLTSSSRRTTRRLSRCSNPVSAEDTSTASTPSTIDLSRRLRPQSRLPHTVRSQRLSRPTCVTLSSCQRCVVVLLRSTPASTGLQLKSRLT